MAAVALLLAGCLTGSGSTFSSATSSSKARSNSSATSSSKARSNRSSFMLGSTRSPESKISTLAGQRFFIAWGAIRPSVAAIWKAEGFTSAYKLIGDFAWAKVESQPGRFNFHTWHHDQAVLRSVGLDAFPSLEFLNPPAWFVSQNPDSVVE